MVATKLGLILILASQPASANVIITAGISNCKNQPASANVINIHGTHCGDTECRIYDVAFSHNIVQMKKYYMGFEAKVSNFQVQ